MRGRSRSGARSRTAKILSLSPWTCTRAVLLRQRRTLDVVIATSAADGKEVIERFAGGHGDVLIVKQMAGMGLDLPWVKVGLDLSATRTYAALIQRMFRPATPHADAV